MDILKKKGAVACRLPASPDWGIFHSPEKILEARTLEDVNKCIAEMERLLANGRYVAGFISYEAAQAFDKAATTKELRDVPLAWLGIYPHPPEVFAFENANAEELSQDKLLPEIKKKDYLDAIKKIKNYIYEGDIYQANFTFRLTSGKISAPDELFLSLQNSHPAPYSAFVNLGEFSVVSNSPELFLEINDEKIFSMPMKGTEARNPIPEKDIEIKTKLQNDPKNRAENLMILDMVRNDLGRICDFGSIKSAPIFHVDTYRTVHQMISKVQGKLKENTSLQKIFKASFPPASITGAPKLRAMEIIKEQEKSPRKIYTGTIGCFFPNRAACLNVAIRTLICFKEKTELGVGGGIVADSQAESEWEESLIKSRFLKCHSGDFKTLETMLWTRKDGIFALREHLRRAAKTQEYFGFNSDLKDAEKKLTELNIPEECDFARLRLLLSKDGDTELQSVPLQETGWGKNTLKIILAKTKTDSNDVFLFHKTTKRKLYDSEFKKAKAQGFDEIIFMNEKNEITEGAISNIFILKSGKWLTPPIECGLLPGIWRKFALKELKAEEAVIFQEDLLAAEKILIGNSVRGQGVVDKLIKS